MQLEIVICFLMFSVFSEKHRNILKHLCCFHLVSLRVLREPCIVRMPGEAKNKEKGWVALSRWHGFQQLA